MLENVQSGITSSTFGKGQAGRISVSVNQLVVQGGSITTGTIGEGQGNAGEVHVIANELQLDDGGSITSSSGLLVGQKMFLGTGNAGEVRVEVSGNLRIQNNSFLRIPSNISSNALATGHGGNVIVHANLLQVGEGGMITANSFGTGNAGRLTIRANTLQLFKQGQITTSAQYAVGGDIHISVIDQLHLHDGQIITSVAGGVGNSGNITLDQSRFIVLNHGQIKAQADAGHGGNIRIVTDHLLTTLDSFISASSRLGIAGQVDITSPDITVSNGLLGLSNQLRPVELTLKHNCGIKSWEEFMNLSTFFAHTLIGHSRSPLGLQSSFIKYKEFLCTTRLFCY